MNVIQSFGVALNMLRLHKLRAFLTMLGVIIGVMSVTMIIMISNGFQAYLDGQFRKLGADTMFVFFDPGRRGQGQSVGNIEKMTTDDLNYVTQRVQEVDIACAVMNIPSQKILFGTRNDPNPNIFATDQNFEELNRFNLLAGRSLLESDVRDRANVCVIGTDVRDRLFPDGDAVGKTVLMSGIALEVVGVLEKSDFMGDSTSRIVMLPISTAQDKWVGGRRLDMMMLRAKPGVKVDVAMDSVWRALMIRSHNKAVYRLDSRESILKVFGGVVGVAGGLLAGIAALSLLVGGIGIMNIMLVSVTERTKEIGLRKAVGAKRNAILTQFLVEAATLSMIGGIIGMSIAWMLGKLVTLATMAKQWPTPEGLQTPFPIMAALFAALFSAFIGMVFGLYPALSASRLDPIVALRTE